MSPAAVGGGTGRRAGVRDSRSFIHNIPTHIAPKYDIVSSMSMGQEPQPVGSAFQDHGLGLLITDECGRILGSALPPEGLGPVSPAASDPLAWITEGLASSDAFRLAVRTCLDTAKPSPFDLELRDPQGETFRLSALASPLLPPASEAVPAAGVVSRVSRPDSVPVPRPLSPVPAVAVLLTPTPSLPSACSDQDHRARLRRAVGEIAHELNRPLAAVLNYAELALQDPDLSETARARLAMVVEHAEACREVVRHSLEVGVAGARPTEAVDVNAAVRSAASSLSHVLGNTRLDLALDPSVPAIVGSAQELGAAIRNLLENAVDAARESADSPRVEVVTTPTDAGVRVTVRDNGPGIDPTIAARLFEPFVTTKADRQGAGLGLSIARGIILDHDGQVTAASPADGGALFTVDLPAARRVAVPPAPAAAVAAAPEPARSRRALLIDDDASMRKLLGAYLDTLGYRSTEVGDGLQGLREALTDDYDVIVCDVKMPSMDGLEFHRLLSQQSPERAARVIFSTGVLPTDPADADLRTLPNPRLRKPYRLATLKTALAALR
jgi:CheY-like chemotaxis protein/two-component sensor histidine kinase